MMKIIKRIFPFLSGKDNEEKEREALKQKIHDLSLKRDFEGAIEASNELLLLREGEKT